MSTADLPIAENPFSQQLVSTAYSIYNMEPRDALPPDSRHTFGTILLSGVPEWANRPLPVPCQCFCTMAVDPALFRAPPSPCCCRPECANCTGAPRRYFGGVDELLTLAGRLIADETRWLQGTFARDANGQKCDPRSADAVAWCAYGAVSWCRRLVARPGKNPSLSQDAMRRLDQAAPGTARFAEYQDAPATSHSDVVAAFRRA